MAPSRFLAAALYAGMTMATHCVDLMPKSKPQVAPGVQFKVLANDLNRPRGLVADSEGNLLVVESGGKGIRRIVLNDGEGLDTCIVSSTQLVAESTLNHGIQLSSDGKILFASSLSDVYAYDYDAEKGAVGSAKHVITGMAQHGHSARTLLIPKHNPHLLLVTRGSNSNIDNETIQVESARSQIRIFKVDELLNCSSPVQYSDGQVLGWGLRNSVAVGEDPTTGYIWSADNGIDEMKRKGVDIHNSNPGEELNFHGLPNDTTNGFHGKNYGYPACVSIFDPSNIDGYPGGAKTGLPMVGDQMPSSYTDEWCKCNTVAPFVTFASHQAPLDIKFTPDGRSALISFHGSWNHKPPTGYCLSSVAYSKGFPEADKQSQTAQQQLMWNQDNSVCPDQCFRPVGLLLDEAAKRLFMTSDSTGELYVVTGTDTSYYQASEVLDRL
ncbi:hypothetical protein E4U43_005231 [Claviceps pusilla]|uniref:Pyrroloquinoline quinone-dependent pyranose dehydrogenase beta-propeller domain-containing protein n=1 Tax=Claviceps pusilla TaxID=123648 RepID=A0A9P7SVL6_9HYPO|nr:hypothetical protein E4U43_005231 [Claviceps pusilla]